MKKEKRLIIAVIACMALAIVFVGCSKTSTTTVGCHEYKTEESGGHTYEYIDDVLVSIDGVEIGGNTETAATETTAENIQVEPETSVTTAEPAAEPATEPETAATTAASADQASYSGKYVDLNAPRTFILNGKTYTLGSNTLQDLIDDGVVFDGDDIANAGNNLSKNTESQGFKIILGTTEYGTEYGCQVYVINYSDSNMTTSDCVLSEIYWYNSDNYNDDGFTEIQTLSFSFPLTVTPEELIANSGKPTYDKTYDTGSRDIEYTVDSTMYYSDSGYKFEYGSDGVLKYLTIDWLP